MSSFIPRSKIRGSSLVLFVNLTTGYYSKMNSLELESSNWLQQNMLLVQQIFGHWALGESSGSTMVVFLKPLILVGVDVLLLLWLYGLESYITPLNIIITFFCAILYFYAILCFKPPMVMTGFTRTLNISLDCSLYTLKIFYMCIRLP